MNTDPFDPDRLRLDTSASAPAKRARLPRHALGEWFIKGPVPWNWLEVAARLPGKALPLSLVLWREAGYRKRCTVKLCLRRVGLGVSEYAGRRAIGALESAGLIAVLRKPGHGLEVTILDAPTSPPAPNAEAR